jgi:hypothetical protein
MVPMKRYLIVHRDRTPSQTPQWESDFWKDVPIISIDQFHPESSDHRPVTEARICYSESQLHVIFRVRDRYVKSVAVNNQDMVCQDSCVEFFVQPNPGKGYFNFEINCGGVMLLYYITDPTRTPTGLKRQEPIPPREMQRVQIATTMPRTTPVEIADSTEWLLQASIPLDLMASFAGPISTAPGHVWRANLYKCGDRTSHPHWASWSPVGEELNFHQPDRFGELMFEPVPAACGTDTVEAK